MTPVPCLCCGPVACFFHVTQWRRTSCLKMCSLRSVVSDSSLWGFLMSVTHLHGLHLKCVSACKLTSLWKKKCQQGRQKCTRSTYRVLWMSEFRFIWCHRPKNNWILNLNNVIHHQQSLKRCFTKGFLRYLDVVDVVESWMFIFNSSERFI